MGCVCGLCDGRSPYPKRPRPTFRLKPSVFRLSQRIRCGDTPRKLRYIAEIESQSTRGDP